MIADAASQGGDAERPEWQRWGVRPAMGSLADPCLLRMYAPAEAPRAGALPSDGIEVDGPWHYHDMHQLMCAFEGAFEVEIADGRHLVPRQLAAWIPAGVPHRMSLRNVSSGSIFFPEQMVAAAGDRVRAVLVSPLMREMVREAMRWSLGAPDSAHRTAFFHAMAGFAGEWIEREADLYLPTSADPRLRRALDHVAANLDAKLVDICRLVGMSERSLRRHVKLATGMSLEAYRQRCRLVRAVSLLSDGDLSVVEIAARCGFDNPSSFSRAFGSSMQETPRAYRARLRRCGREGSARHPGRTLA